MAVPDLIANRSPLAVILHSNDLSWQYYDVTMVSNSCGFLLLSHDGSGFLMSWSPTTVLVSWDTGPSQYIGLLK